MRFIRPDPTTIPDDPEARIPTCMVVESTLADTWRAILDEKQYPCRILDEECDEFFFDGGGICHQDEPRISTQVGEWQIGTLVRHAEYLLPKCRRIMHHLPKLGPHIYLPGYWIGGIMTVESGEALAQWLEVQLPSLVAESDQWWARHRERMAAVGGVHVPERQLP